MKESFLHYVWRFKYLAPLGLSTVQGQPVVIHKPGYGHHHAGPDFTKAHLTIGQTEWHGDVEIHLKSTDWQQHKHHLDPAYNKVVLHVVWQHNGPAYRQDGTELPVLELQGRVPQSLLQQQEALLGRTEVVACQPWLAQLNPVHKLGMLDKALTERVYEKSGYVRQALQQTNGHWPETAWRVLARNMGFKTNTTGMEALVQALPFTVLQKEAANLNALEALLLGHAGLLEKPMPQEPYYQSLQKEYTYLAKKYKLTERKLNPGVWKFLRLRPANFPTLRLAQLAAILHKHHQVFSLFKQVTNMGFLIKQLEVVPSPYWRSHYTFGKATQRAVGRLGKESIRNLAINTVVPVLVAYGQSLDDQDLVDAALHLLTQIPAEDNHILRQWGRVGWPVRTAFDSQALIQLHNSYCQHKRCLECNIGSAILKLHDGVP